MRSHTCLLAIALFAGSASAQKLAVFDPIASTFTEVQPPTALLPPPSPPTLVYTTVPLPPPVPFVVTPGDSTFDNQSGQHWVTDGTAFLLAAWSPTLGGGPVMAPIPIPPALLAALGGPITGIAFDPQILPGFGQLMHTVSASGFVLAVAPIPGLPIAGLGFQIPFSLAAPITGLEWDGATSSLWAVDAGGTAYNFSSGGSPIGAPVLPAVPPPGSVNDIAIDKIGTLNAAGLRPLYVLAGTSIYDITDPGAVAFPAGPPGVGLAFLNAPAMVPARPGCEGCPGLWPFGPTAFTTGPSTAGNTSLMVGMSGLLPGFSLGGFAFDTAAAPLPFPFPAGPAACPVGLTLGPTLILVAGGPADAAGRIYTPLGLAGVPIGSFLHNQNFTFCTALPGGVAFSRLQTITVGGL